MTYTPGFARPNTTDETGFAIDIGAPDALTWRPLGSYMSAEFDWDWQFPGTFALELQPDHGAIPVLRNCRRKVVHIRTYRNGIPWDGRVRNCRVTGRPGREVVRVTGTDNKFWTQRGLAWVNNLLPPEIQIALTGKQDVVWGPPDYVFKNYLAKVMTRLRKPVYGLLPLRYTVPELPDLADIDTLDDLLDIIAEATDELIVLQARFPQLSDLFEQSVNRLQMGLSCNLWTPADGPSPWVFNTDTLAQLQSVIDYSSDNFLNFANLGNILGLADPETWGTMTRAGYVFHTHAIRDMRKMQWRTDGNQILWYDFDTEHADAHRVVVGGKAPEMVNQLIEWGANFAIQLLINLLLPGLGLGATVGDLFDNIFFAYQQFWDDELEDDLGEHGFGEVFGDNTSAWSLDSYTVGQTALKDHSGHERIEMQVESGGPDGRGYSFGVDNGTSRRFQCGDMHTFYDRGAVAEQFVSHVKVSDKRDGRMVEQVTLGERKFADPWDQALGRIGEFASLSRGIANTT